ncbi:MAG: NTP transferase domain-containing protein [Bacteroidales bacterium]|jgi:NDP-sugar pyrophosphorylase family protein|nr:NTP transferase domain-containing protein [Bacteroidales bacterium]
MERQLIVFIPAAGLGSRLGALTADKPKALVEFCGKPLLLHLLEKLRSEGFYRVVINVHHYAQQIIDYVKTPAVQSFCSVEISDESHLLLDTGGALVKALPLLDSDSVLVYNVDIFSSIKLRNFVDTFAQTGGGIASNPGALLAVRSRNTSRRLLFEKNTLQLCGWRNEETSEVKKVEGRYSTYSTENMQPFAFSGIHIIKTELIKKMYSKFGFEKPFSIIDGYLYAAESAKILAYPHDNDTWQDMGKVEAFH